MSKIKSKDFPKKAGVYKFVCNDTVVYVGSSKNLYNRMRQHKSALNYGCTSRGKQVELYQFLQQNDFSIEFEIAGENHKQMEQEWIDKFKPRFNLSSALAIKERQKQKSNEWHRKNYSRHKHNHDKYLNQLCEYNGEIIKLNALSARFCRAKIPLPTQEAKKYLIETPLTKY
jgi:excinuclease UvrABC nuclease subunit